ncbi:PTS sugar transporter subunit IIA [Oceanirhabdus sp. W0125-5]|uniref:PTS sugar transporter subunit IIA n=1 Tax=Oceanirhabdus sp. W0125-5 TaxID=2999116 RepID=UPI0022F30702|nr:PTS glucose transporter subunit IIA [Oceanirhabdus sp. W0125-5]WBW94750.1 PTS glucose transporter subunit IIA [Oceanirhabdus sp. W0125-5]
MSKNIFSLLSRIFGKKQGETVENSSNKKTTDDMNISSKETKTSIEEFISPLEGKLLELSSVPDAVFSQKMMGDGFAIEPVNGEVVSPITGTVATLFHTKHAIGLVSDNGREVLIHFGIDTVALNGEGFTAYVKQGDKVKAGDKLLSVDLNTVKEKVPSVITPIIFTNLKEGESVQITPNKKITLKEKNIVTIK